MSTYSKIAWAGELELMEAKWNDKDAHLVKLKLVTPNEERPNPFKSFTKRRKGRAGTRFIASLSHVQGGQTDKIAYNGEFMLAGWADSSTQGYTVTFWCERPDEGIHPFEGYLRNKDSFMAALVELDEDDMPVDQARRERVERATQATRQQAEGGESVESAPAEDALPELIDCSCDNEMQMQCSDARRKSLSAGVRCHWGDRGPEGELTPAVQAAPKKGPRKLSQYAAMLCGNEMFHRWIYQSEMVQSWLRTDGVTTVDTALAARWMRTVLQIESRRELDNNDLVAARYHAEIRQPFVIWQEAAGVLDTTQF